MVYFSMKIKNIKRELIFFVFFIAIFIASLSLVSANFACGFINDSEKLSASWTEVLVYYDENPQETTICKTSPENKFCCDLDIIDSVTWGTGKLVYAEVLLSEQGYVAGPVSLLTSEEGYDVFPEMQLKRAITFNKPMKTILIEESSLSLNLSLHENYNNLKYQLNNNSEQLICEDCTQAKFSIQGLQKGKNNLVLTAFNPVSGRNLSETFYIFSLDYLNLVDSFECKKCRTLGDKVYVPSRSEVNLIITMNSSHDISGTLNVYFPVDWELSEDYLPEDYSLTHDLVEWEIEDSKKATITLPLVSSGTFLKRKDSFKYEFFNSEISKERIVMVYSLIKRFPFSKYREFSPSFYFQDCLFERTSPAEPLILVPEQDVFEIIAIYPKEEIRNAYSYITYKERKFFGNSYISFNLLTNIASRKIDQILFRFKILKEQRFKFSSSGEINYELYDQDSEYNYYESYVDKKGSFKVKIY